MTDFGSRLKERRLELKLTQNELGKKVGISGPAISQLEKGESKSPSSENLIELADSLEVKAKWLLHGRGEKEEFSHIAFTRSEIHLGELWILKWTDIYKDIPYAQHKDIGLRQRKLIITKDDDLGENDFLLVVEGRSMSPTSGRSYPTGSLIHIHNGATPKDGDCIVVKLPGEEIAIFRQFIIEGGKHFIKPLNPDWPEKTTPLPDGAEIIGVADEHLNTSSIPEGY